MAALLAQLRDPFTLIFIAAITIFTTKISNCTTIPSTFYVDTLILHALQSLARQEARKVRFQYRVHQMPSIAENSC